MTIKYFKYPFGVDGDLLTIPNPTQLSGVVSYQAGFPIDYQLVDTDPASLNVPRNQFNQLMFDTTSAIQQLQQNGFPIHITAAMNDGSAYAYDKNSYVRATDGNAYYSLINANTDVPPTANWQLVGSSVSQYFNFAIDTGIADHYIIAPNPADAAYMNGDFILLRPIHANTGACDIDVNGLGVIPIKTMSNLNPTAGMIIPTGMYILIYFGGNFILTNPTLGNSIRTVNLIPITVSGTYTPTAGMSYITVRAVGGGGSGGSVVGQISTVQGGGGGGGECAEVRLTAAQIGGSQVVTIGAGGAAPTSGNHDGNDGTATSLGAYLIANGGKGGKASAVSNGWAEGGLGGTGGTGDVLYPGGKGASGLESSFQTQGGDSVMGVGAQSPFFSANSALNGVAGNNYGGGGSGALTQGVATNKQGGAGAPGILIITEYCS